MKRVLSIQDLSCLGRCSLTVALPVISAMGSSCAVLPTALLSTHTGFPGPHVQPLTEHIPHIHDHWKSLDIRFDAVCTGYLANEAQTEAVLPLLRHYRENGSLMIVDPAMGDRGRLYRGLKDSHVDAMKSLCRSADILLPNMTEAALLTGMPYREDPDEGYLAELSRELLCLGARHVIITGFTMPGDRIGYYGASREVQPFSYRCDRIPRQFHGTGDLFAAVLTGGLMAGLSIGEAATLSAKFVRQCVAETKEVTPFGVEFEGQLPYLWSLLGK